MGCFVIQLNKDSDSETQTGKTQQKIINKFTDNFHVRKEYFYLFMNSFMYPSIYVQFKLNS